MSDSVITVENLGKKYRIKHQAERQRYVALRDVLADKTKSVARRLWQLGRSKIEAGRSDANSNLPSANSHLPRTQDFWALNQHSAWNVLLTLHAQKRD